MIKEAISTLVAGRDLSVEGAVQAMEEIMNGEATPAQFGAFVTALRMKGETVGEIAGLAQVMRDKALQVRVGQPVIDTCGTGGDASHTFNISTAAALVVAGAGLAVAKHGNRAVTSQCGSADVLEALGVKIDLGAEGVERCISEVGIGFMFAPVFHPAMKYAAAPRREIGIRSVFNILGPLTNPAGAVYQVLGVGEASLAMKLAEALKFLGSKHALVVHGEDGVDEVSLGGRTLICELKDDSIRSYYFVPEDVGFRRVSRDGLRATAVAENIALLRSVLSGVEGPGRDVVLLNAAAALVAGDEVETMAEGVEVAKRSVESGAALDKLEKLVRVSQGLG